MLRPSALMTPCESSIMLEQIGAKVERTFIFALADGDFASRARVELFVGNRQSIRSTVLRNNDELNLWVP